MYRHRIVRIVCIVRIVTVSSIHTIRFFLLATITHRFVHKGEEGDGKFGNVYFVATKRTNDNTLIVKLASVDPNDILIKAQIQGSTTSSTGLAYILTAGPGVDPSTVQNTMNNPNAASVISMPVSATNGTWSIIIPSWSVVVVTLPL